MARDPYAAAATPVSSVNKEAAQRAKRERELLARRAKAKKAAAAKRTAGFQHGPDSYVAAAAPVTEVHKPAAQAAPRERADLAARAKKNAAARAYAQSRKGGFQHGPTAVPTRPVIAKPSFETAVAARRGDKAAQREVALWKKSARARRVNERQVGDLTDQALFGEAEGAIKGAAKTASPLAMGLTESLSPTTWVKDFYKAVREGNVAMAGVTALSFVPGVGFGSRSGIALQRLARIANAEARAAGATPKVARQVAREAVAAAKAETKAAKPVKFTRTKTAQGTNHYSLPGHPEYVIEPDTRTPYAGAHGDRPIFGRVSSEGNVQIKGWKLVRLNPDGTRTNIGAQGKLKDVQARLVERIKEPPPKPTPTQPKVFPPGKVTKIPPPEPKLVLPASTPARAVRAAYPEGTLFHGSPEGRLTKEQIDPWRHTEKWWEGIGFYITESAEKAQRYARGVTARGARRAAAKETGAVSGWRLAPGARVLDMEAPADMDFWRRMAERMGMSRDEFDEYVTNEFKYSKIGPPKNWNARSVVHDLLLEYHGQEATYALEEMLEAEGIQATMHLEGDLGTRVWVIKDPSILEEVVPSQVPGANPVKPGVPQTQPRTGVPMPEVELVPPRRPPGGPPEEPPLPPGGEPPIPPSEPPPSSRAAQGGFQHGTRTLEHPGGKIEQMPAQARSKVSQKLIEKPADWISQAMEGEGRLARGAKFIFRTAPAGARVEKQAGRLRGHRAGRARSRMEHHIKALPKRGSDLDVAHYWYAQLPTFWRNLRGLRRVRQMQAEELRRVTSGEAKEELNNARIHLLAIIPTLEHGSEDFFATIQALEHVKIQIRDIPQLVDDLSASIARLDRVIANPKRGALNHRILNAMRAFAEESEKIAGDAEKLTPEVARAREGLVARWAGLRPDGTEIYVGHRLGKDMSAPGMLPAAGVGKVKLPPGLARRNKAILITQGRADASTHVSAEDWMAREKFHFALIDRDNLAQMGKPLAGDNASYVPADHYLVNPKGRAVPSQEKLDQMAMLVDSGDEEALFREAQTIVEDVIVDRTKFSEMIDFAKANGVDWSELRVVPKESVERYYAQFGPAKPSTDAGTAYDIAVDGMAASVIFARLGYIPKAIVQNIIMGVPHQGVYLPSNMARALQLIKEHPVIANMISEEVGMGFTGQLGKEAKTKYMGKVAGAVTSVADRPFRISSWLHEIAKDDYISRLKPSLNEQDIAVIDNLLRSPIDSPGEAQLNIFRTRSQKPYGDFERFTPQQRKLFRRAFIIPGWLWAGSRYPFDFVASYPLRSAAMAYVAAGEPGAPEELQVNKPIDEYFAKGVPSWLEGVNIPGWGHQRTGSILPATQGWEIIRAGFGGSPQTLGSFGNPVLLGLINAAFQQKELPGGGTERVGTGEAITSFIDRVVPNKQFFEDLLNPGQNPLYPHETVLDRIIREAGGPANYDKTTARRYELYEKGTPQEKARFNNNIDKAAMFNDFKRIGVPVTPEMKRYFGTLFREQTKFDTVVAGKKTAKEKLKAILKYDKTHDRRITDHDDKLKELEQETETTNQSNLDSLKYWLWGGKEIEMEQTELTKALNELKLEPTPRGTVR